MSTTRPRVRRLPLNAAAVLTVVVCLFPVYWMVATAFTPTRDIQSDNPVSCRRVGPSTTSVRPSVPPGSVCSGATVSSSP